MGLFELISTLWTQSLPPAPTFTEKELPDLSGKTFIVTGGASGVGYQLVRLLYQKNGNIYIAARGAEKASTAVAEISAAFPASKGKLHFLHLDLNDLTTIKASAEDFLAKEDRLDVLWNNAGVMVPPKGSKTKQEYELQLGTNCLGPYLFTQLLLPILRKTAASSAPGSVRVAWAGSIAIDLGAPNGGMDLDDLTYEKREYTPDYLYAQSKAGNLFLGTEFAKVVKSDGIMSLSFNPGNLRTPLQRHLPGWMMTLTGWLLYDPIFGGYTELYAGLSPDLTIAQTGSYIVPWGRVRNPRSDIIPSLKSKSEGGNGKAEEFLNWCEDETRQYR